MTFEWVAVHFSRDVTVVRQVRIFEVVQDLSIKSGSKMLNNLTGKQRNSPCPSNADQSMPFGITSCQSGKALKRKAGASS